ncbi:hypothetical protein ZWY2020_002576 [Hordeum vulgare]|nr:hypothetical protein ZWY2020_002576 [Hordeum vulgare]
MEDFMPRKAIDEYEFKTIPIWVRVYGIAMGMMNSEVEGLVGEKIGEVLDIDMDANGNAMGEFMRIKVQMDITIPIMRLTTLEIKEDEEEHIQTYEQLMGVDAKEKKERKEGKEKLITLKYEHLLDFCYNCVIINHKEKSCPNETKKEGERQFGPWLHATIFWGSSSEEEIRSSNGRRDFWLTNSTSSNDSKMGSDGPSWRKNASF